MSMSGENEMSPGAGDHENECLGRNRVHILKMYVGWQGDHSF